MVSTRGMFRLCQGPAWTPSGISVRAEDDGLGAAGFEVLDGGGQGRVGVGDPVGFDRGDGGGDEGLHIGVGGGEAVPAVLAEAVLVKAHGQRSGGAHEADRAWLDILAAQVGGGGVDDVQDRGAGGVLHLVEPAVRGVAGDGDGAAVGMAQAGDAAQQPGQRVLAAGQFAAGAIRDAGIGPEHGGDVVLVAPGGCQQRQAQHELCTGQRPHAAEHAKHFVVWAVHLACSWGADVIAAVVRAV